MICVLIFVGIAVATTVVLSQDASARALSPDEREYLALAERGLSSFNRPWGYPAILSVFAHRQVAGISTVIWLQTAFNLLRAAAIYRILRDQFAAAWLMAVLCAGLGLLSFTSLSLTQRFLADNIIGCVSPWIWYLWIRSQEHARTVDAVFAGLLACGAFLLKPIVILWLPVFLCTLIIHRAGQRQTLPRIAMAGTPLILVNFSQSYGNLQNYGVFTASGISVETMARYLIPAVICCTTSPMKWNEDCIQAQRTVIDQAGTGLSVSELHTQRKQTIEREIRQHPTAVIAATFHIAYRNLPRPFYLHEMTLVQSDAPPMLVTLGKVATLTLWLLSLAGMVRSLRNRPFRAPALTLLLFAGIFYGATLISFWEGARLAFPMEWTLFVSCGALFSPHRPNVAPTDAASTSSI